MIFHRPSLPDINFRKFLNACKKFFCISARKVHSLESQAVLGKRICGSSRGWLIVADKTSAITLKNPLKEIEIQLPPFCPAAEKQKLVHKAILSSDPETREKDYIVMIIYGEERELACYESSNKTWTMLEEAGSFYEDIIWHRRDVYAVDGYGRVVRFENKKVKEIAAPWFFKGNRVYLVVMERELSVIIRYWKNNPVSGQQVTYRFEVYDLKRPEHWIQTDLDGWSVFLGQNQSVAVRVVCNSRIKGNCIYFTDDNEAVHKNNIPGGGDQGVFDVEDQTISSLHSYLQDFPSRGVWPQSIWLN